MAAIKNLCYGDYTEFLGVRTSGRRTLLYNRLRPDLSPEAKKYWDAQSKALKKGMVYMGRWEQYFRTLSVIVKLFRRKKIKNLFSFTSLEEQKKFCREKWNTIGWEKFIKFVCHRFFWKYVFKDPGFYRYVSKDFPVGNYIYACLSKTLETYLARENHFFSFLVHNRYISENSLPIYLQEKYYPLLKRNVSRIEIVTDSLQHYLENLPNNCIHKFSLSDISSYTSEEDYQSILKSCVRVAVPEAIFCLRHFLVKREIPETLENIIQRFPDLEKDLTRTDMSYAFTFTIGQIR